MILIPLTRYEFRLFPFRSPLLGELTFVLYSCRYWEVSLPCVTICTAMNSLQDNWVWAQLGFPIRKSPDQSLFDSYPRLIAAYHVLLRFFAPRHSTYALCSLIWNYFLFSFQCATTDSVNLVVINNGPTSTTTIYTFIWNQRLKISLFSLSSVDLRRVELLTSSLQMKRSGQLSYRPVSNLVGAPRVELGTSVLSGLRSSQLSYAPLYSTHI